MSGRAGSRVLTGTPVGRSAEAYVAATLAGLAALRRSAGWGWLEISRPGPTAAFSRRDTLAPGYPAAADAARRHGFEPVVRPAGGRLAAYHHGAVVVDLLARHPAPAAETDQRFAAFAGAVAAALKALGVDARVGPVPGEYCPGRFSVNAGGRTKLAGIAQRLTGGSFLLTAVVLVADPEPVRALLSEAYPRLGLPWEPVTVGCVADQIGWVSTEQVRAAVLTALTERLPLGAPASAPAEGGLRLPLLDRWQPGR